MHPAWEFTYVHSKESLRPVCSGAHRLWFGLQNTLPVSTASCLSLLSGGCKFTSVPFAFALLLYCRTQSAQSALNHPDLGPMARGFTLALGSTRICLPLSSSWLSMEQMQSGSLGYPVPFVRALALVLWETLTW